MISSSCFVSSDLLQGRANLSNFQALAACGGFSYGDVLGAGQGWAKTILFNDQLKEMFQTFFQRTDTITLGVCNGCQMLSNIKELIPGASHWPQFTKNLSNQFEARFTMVEINDSPSIFFKDMQGSKLPIAVAHGEGQATGENINPNLVTLRYLNNQYPQNPNGSPEGVTGLTTEDGRATIMMPHPERVFLTVQNSWHPKEWDEMSPWMKIFMNAKCWTE